MAGALLEPTWARFGAENAQNDPRMDFYRFSMDFGPIFGGFFMIFRCFGRHAARFYCSPLVREQHSRFFRSFEKNQKNDAKRLPKSHVFGSKIDPRASQGRFFLWFLTFVFSIFWAPKRRLYIIRFLPRFQKTRRQSTPKKRLLGAPGKIIQGFIL